MSERTVTINGGVFTESVLVEALERLRWPQTAAELHGRVAKYDTFFTLLLDPAKLREKMAMVESELRYTPDNYMLSLHDDGSLGYNSLKHSAEAAQRGATLDTITIRARKD